MVNKDSSKDKMMELNCYDKDDNPRYGWDVYVQRISCYIQHKETVQEMSQYQDIANPYREVKNENNTHTYVPDLDSLDNGNTIIIFENSQSGSIEDTLINARQQWESRWRRLPFYLAYESHDVSNDDSLALECMKIVLQDVWKSVTENWESFLDISDTHVSILEDKIYEYVLSESIPPFGANPEHWDIPSGFTLDSCLKASFLPPKGMLTDCDSGSRRMNHALRNSGLIPACGSRSRD